MSWVDHIEGTWLADDLRRAFVDGAKWWEFESTGATMWNSDKDKAEAKAEEHYPGGGLPGGHTTEAERLRAEVERLQKRVELLQAENDKLDYLLGLRSSGEMEKSQ